ncbi:MAG: hypothetical protein EOP09_04565, partial [Proteobacteria bacterium]
MASPDSGNNAKNWLVKSSTRILGPYTRDEVVQLLSRRQITIIDEIRQPDLRWNYIRETRYFKEIVKNLRFEDDHSREDTMTSTSTSTGTGTLTKTDHGMLNDDLTPVPPFTPAVSTPPEPVPGMRDVTPGPEIRPHLKASGPAKSFGNLQDQRVQSRIQRQNFVLRAILLFILVGGLLYASYAFLGKDRRTDLNYEQLVASALKYKELGLYQKSLGFYRKAAALREVDLETQFQMVFVLINEDRQSLKGRRVIERALLKENRSRQEIINGNLGIALSFMIEGDLRQSEDYLQRTMGLEANNEAAKLNMALIQLKKNNFAEAYKSFEAMTRGDVSGYPLILLGKTIALIEMSKANVDKDKLRSGINEIKAFSGKSHFLRKELALLLIYLNRLSAEPAGELDAIAMFMDEPYDLSRQFVKDLRLDWRAADWEALDKYCAELYSPETSPVMVKAVRAMCMLQNNRDLEATKLIDEVLAQAPKQLASIQAQAENLKKLGRLKEANILFQTSEFKQTRMALYIQGESCLKSGELPCADQAYKDLALKDFGDVVSHYGLAQVASLQSDRARLQNEIKAGFESEGNYVP